MKGYRTGLLSVIAATDCETEQGSNKIILDDKHKRNARKSKFATLGRDKLIVYISAFGSGKRVPLPLWIRIEHHRRDHAEDQ